MQNFELVTKNLEPKNIYKVVHIYNKNQVYHINRQILLDSFFIEDEYNYFYNIIYDDISDFNKKYKNFSCLIFKSKYEADIYLNVKSHALKYIISYLQTGKINEKLIDTLENKKLQEIIDLAKMLGMSKIVDKINMFNIENRDVIINKINYFFPEMSQDDITECFNYSDNIKFIELENQKCLALLYILMKKHNNTNGNIKKTLNEFSTKI